MFARYGIPDLINGLSLPLLNLSHSRGSGVSNMSWVAQGRTRNSCCWGGSLLGMVQSPMQISHLEIYMYSFSSVDIRGQYMVSDTLLMQPSIPMCVAWATAIISFHMAAGTARSDPLNNNWSLVHHESHSRDIVSQVLWTCSLANPAG